MRGNTHTLDHLLNNPVDEPLFLDGRYWQQFLDWLQPANPADTARLELLQNEQISVCMFKYQLDSVQPDSTTRNKRLKEIGIKLMNKTGTGAIKPGDNLFIEEIQRTYFRNRPTANSLAQLLLLARRHSQLDDRVVNIITQHGGFERIPDVNVYYIPGVRRNEMSEFPADFDFLADFDIHPAIAEAIQDSVNENDFPRIVKDAYSGLELYVQSKCIVPNPSYDPSDPDSLSHIVTPNDGGALMRQAFDPSNGATPLIKLNDLSDRDGRRNWMNEQNGMNWIACGIVKMFRNPLSHRGGLHSSYAENRLRNRKEALKLVALFSYICERIDQGTLDV